MILGDENGSVISYRSKPINGTCSPIEAEGLGLREVISWLIQYDVISRVVTIELDAPNQTCQSLVTG